MKITGIAVTAPEGYEVISDGPMLRNRRTWDCRPQMNRIPQRVDNAILPVEQTTEQE